MYKQLTSMQRPQNINFAPKKTAREESLHIVGICQSALCCEMRCKSSQLGKYAWFEAYN